MRNVHCLFKQPRRRKRMLRGIAMSFALGALAAIAAPNLALSTIEPPPAANAKSAASARIAIERKRMLAHAPRDVDCADFDNQAEAQAFMAASRPVDPHRLDSDNDGVVCERLP
jgi:hypothetical protein